MPLQQQQHLDCVREAFNGHQHQFSKDHHRHSRKSQVGWVSGKLLIFRSLTQTHTFESNCHRLMKSRLDFSEN